MPHRTNITVRFSELDPYDHVNHACYVEYLEVARVEALRSVGVGLGRLKSDGLHLVVTRVELRFHQPALADDELEVRSHLVELRRATATWAQSVHRGDDLLASASVSSAVCNPAGRPVRVPTDLHERLEQLRGPAA